MTMKIIFIGSVEFSLRALQATIQAGGNVVAICTLKRSPFNADFCDLTPFAKKSEIPCIYVNDINSTETVSWIKQFSPTVIFCFGWSRLLKKEILSIAPLGVVGFHPAALPLNRGRHPIIWALALGLKKTGSTFFFMDEGADSGDIISQVIIDVEGSDDARSLYDKVIATALNQIQEFVPKFEKNSVKRIKQDHTIANTWRKRGPKDGIIDWRMSSASIYNLVRALTKPYVGAEFMHKEIKYKVWKAEIISYYANDAEPGKVVDIIDGCPAIKCGEGVIKLVNTNPTLVSEKGEYL
jgi:methionyl-tRNA formyltransferase